MKIVEHRFCDNRFPPTIIECAFYNHFGYVNYTKYTYPNDGKYDSSVFGVWKVKYKKIDFAYWCEGQKHIHL